MNRKYLIIISVISITVILIFLGIFTYNNYIKKEDNEIVNKTQYIKISPEQMKSETSKMSKEEYIILDVRTREEYLEVRIPGSTLLTLDKIEAIATSVIPNKNIKLYVHCRSGARSAVASKMLINLGYTKVYDFGGIMDYPYETEKGPVK